MWHCTQNQQLLGVNVCGSDVKDCERRRAGTGDEYSPCKKYGEVWCMSFHNNVSDVDALSCHGGPDSCALSRLFMIRETAIDHLSRCQKLPLDQQPLGEQK